MPPVQFPATRWSLIARLPGQPQHVASLLGLYADAIGEYLSRKLVAERHDRVQDVIQDVLVDLLGKPDVLAQAQPGSGSKFRYYIMNLAWLSALNALRHARRRDNARLDEAAVATPPAPDQHAAMDRAWHLSVVRQAMDEVRAWSRNGTLEPEAWTVLEAHLVHGRNLRDIAAELGLSLATCSRRLARARTLLQQAITERLRLAGEIGADDDPAQACVALLAGVSP